MTDQATYQKWKLGNLASTIPDECCMGANIHELFDAQEHAESVMYSVEMSKRFEMLIQTIKETDKIIAKMMYPEYNWDNNAIRYLR